MFSVNKVFRAEPSSTTRHLTEVVSLDAEMGFIDSWQEVRDMAESTVRFILEQVKIKNKEHLELLGADVPTMIEQTPTLKHSKKFKTKFLQNLAVMYVERRIQTPKMKDKFVK
jgi:nondiscriminating aspartyl-tRNA synthetase